MNIKSLYKRVSVFVTLVMRSCTPHAFRSYDATSSIRWQLSSDELSRLREWWNLNGEWFTRHMEVEREYLKTIGDPPFARSVLRIHYEQEQKNALKNQKGLSDESPPPSPG